MPTMFLDTYLSAVGRATNVNLTTLRKQSGPGCDPCWDHKAAVAEEAAKKAEEKAIRLAEQEEQISDWEKMYNTLSAVYDEPFEDNDNGFHFEEYLDQKPKVQEMRRAREEMRSSSAFKNRSRADTDKLDVTLRWRAPPLGTYRPRDDCCARFGKVGKPPDKVPAFGLREKTRSRKVSELEEEISELRAQGLPYDHLLKTAGRSTEVMEEIPENKLAQRKDVVYVNMSKQLPRPDLLSALGRRSTSEPVAINDENVLNGYKKCAKYGRCPRQPCFEFAKQTKGPGPSRPSSAPIKPSRSSRPASASTTQLLNNSMTVTGSSRPKSATLGRPFSATSLSKARWPSEESQMRGRSLPAMLGPDLEADLAAMPMMIHGEQPSAVSSINPRQRNWNSRSMSNSHSSATGSRPQSAASSRGGNSKAALLESNL
eukprot:TRINITY_DN36674_c0_g1_i1.p1 TRINITY_DN36674_c0_g1~~TRINITY_DN36674_c0_g1_i1.p1  ORF type:complete len:428 (+),score=67.06 TRINITY_DN36674_c0_g1_i1:1204-2487(+)